MIKIIAAFIGFMVAYSVWAQTLTPTSGGSGSITAGSTPTVGCSAGQVLFSSGSVAQCSTITITGAGGISETIPSQFFIQGGLGAGRGISVAVQGGGASMEFGNDSGLIFSSGTNPNLAPDTGVYRSVPGVIIIGNGSAGNSAGGYITGTASLVNLTTGTNADFLCLAANGTVLLQNAACTISSLRFKPDWKPYTDDALTKVAAMDVGTFHLQTGPNADPNARSLQAGLSAESVAAIAPECAVYENDMRTPKSYRQECVLALLVKAIQELKNDHHRYQ